MRGAAWNGFEMIESTINNIFLVGWRHTSVMPLHEMYANTVSPFDLYASTEL